METAAEINSKANTRNGPAVCKNGSQALICSVKRNNGAVNTKIAPINANRPFSGPSQNSSGIITDNSSSPNIPVNRA